MSIKQSSIDDVLSKGFNALRFSQLLNDKHYDDSDSVTIYHLLINGSELIKYSHISVYLLRVIIKAFGGNCPVIFHGMIGKEAYCYHIDLVEVTDEGN
jgi:hypothetical protein